MILLLSTYLEEIEQLKNTQMQGQKNQYNLDRNINILYKMPSLVT
jgi:hypothetical protein